MNPSSSNGSGSSGSEGNENKDKPQAAALDIVEEEEKKWVVSEDSIDESDFMEREVNEVKWS